MLAPAIAAAVGELSPAASAMPVDLELPDLDGRQRSLQEFRDRIVLVNFWASWCMPCLEEMPSIQRLSDALREKPFIVVGVNVGEAELRVEAIARRLGIAFPLLLDRDSAVFERWGATVLPTTYLLDGAGVVRYVGRGPLEWDSNEILDLIDGLVNGTPAGHADPEPG